MKNAVFCLAVLSGLAFSCSSPRVEELVYEGGEIPLMQRVKSETKVLDIEDGHLVDYNDLVEDIQYLPLGDEKGLIGEIRQILYHQGTYYVYDFKQDVVFLFDEKGKCFKKIDDRGNGPEEYLGIANIDINPVDAELIINDRLASQILFYDLHGNFKYKRKILAQTDIGFWLKDSTTVFLMEAFQNGKSEELKEYGLLEMKGDSIVRKGFKYLPSQIGYCGGQNVRRGYNNSLYYRPLFSDSIYRIESDSTYSLAYYAKLKNSVWKKNYQSSEFVNWWNAEGETLFPWFFETKDFFIGLTNAHSTDDKMVWVIYDKKNDRTNMAKMEMYDNIQQLDRLWGFDPYGVKKDYLIIAMPGYAVEEYIKERVKDGKMKIADPRLEAIVKKMDSDSNPLLILTKFKSVDE